ncbi:MAG: hypothetical protein RLZZ337_1729 [Bacteroidota bacterium]|jgi:peroxiredoxin
MKNKILTLILISSVAALACTPKNNTTTGDDEKPKQEATKTGYAIGDEATDFSMKNVDGKMVSLANYPDAKGFFVIFTCNHCPYALAYEQRIMDLDKKYAPLGYPVIAISPNDPALVPEDSYEEMQKLAAEKAYSFPYLIDEKQEIYPQYGATKTPHVFLLNKENGKNIVRYIGAIDDNYSDANDVDVKYAENAVDSLLAGEEIALNTTKAIGCSIKDKRNKK